MKTLSLYIVLISGILLCNCASTKIKNIQYTQVSNSTASSQPTLNVFMPNKGKASNPVLIFVHGGYWEEGKKETYGFLGRNFAKKGIVTVIIDYTLSPKANYDDMAKEVAQAIAWTKANISEYKGDETSIFLTGHSAGGHLVALVSTSPKYIEDKSVIQGVILNDAAGLDMYSYLQKYPPTEKHHYKTTWTENPENWKAASPIYFLNDGTAPFKIYVGSKTHESISVSNDAFIKELKNYQPGVSLEILNKKHVPMMSQYFFPWNDRYDEIIKFIEANQ
ncbi:acetyl esterase/lipase [Gelidibacter algens]|uniref:Acetyl esterase/lipase n=1 Tax=Gelidibacter algens TaxID=49280 RepID=A0A1A7QZG4_9FLAO|nr:alpha/beta hydrolase [Gelidibacter algens]OBX24956.1 esterase [Gelidibacter algens]RAJ24794.1 acetyl esterase/lipase [Gelidibacter algens]